MQPPAGRRARARARCRPPGEPDMPQWLESTSTASGVGVDARAASRRCRRCESGPRRPPCCRRQRREQIFPERGTAVAVAAGIGEEARQPKVAEHRHPAHRAQHLRRHGQPVAHGRTEHRKAAHAARDDGRRARVRTCRRGSGRSARPAHRCRGRASRAAPPSAQTSRSAQPMLTSMPLMATRWPRRLQPVAQHAE